MNITNTNCLESLSIRCGNITVIERLIVLEFGLVRAIVTTCTTINASPKFVFWESKSISNSNVVQSTHEHKELVIIGLGYSSRFIGLLLALLGFLLPWPLTLFSTTFGIAIRLCMSRFPAILASYTGL
jgi:hypothetical protein